ncbi:MAG: hypothetical protein ACFCU4_05830 [Puniceicoccaceae bacterium]
MKNILLALSLLSLALFAGCGSSSGPEEVAEKFMNALVKEADVAKASSMATGEAAQLLTMIQSMAGEEMQSEKSPDFKFKHLRNETEGDSVKVIFEDPESKGETFVKVTKVDGEWKVSALPKE